MSTCVEWMGYMLVTLLAIKIVYNIYSFFYTTYFGAAFGKNIDLRQYGPWAVVTGATDGIGKAYARKLASLGLNVVLISRTYIKLQKVAEEIRKESGLVQIKTVAVDFTEGQAIYPVLKKELTNLEIGILINNVGIAVGFAESYTDLNDDQQLYNIINCNVMSMARLTHIVLPQMLKRKKGIILNIGSIAGALPTPMAVIYGATKAFVDKFSRDLAAECKAVGVIVQTVLPGFVVSNMSQLKKSSFATPSAEEYVESQLKTIGLESRTGGYWFHTLMLYWGELGRFLIPSALDRLAISFLKEYRKRILTKKRKTT